MVFEESLNWIKRSKDTHNWNLWMARRIRNTLAGEHPLYIWGEPGETEVSILIKVRLSLWDRCYHYVRDLIDSPGVAQGAPWMKPVWLREWEWFQLCTAVDVRFQDIPEAYVAFQDMVPLRGTGLKSLNEFDMERAAETFLAKQGMNVEVCYKDFPPELF